MEIEEDPDQGGGEGARRAPLRTELNPTRATRGDKRIRRPVEEEKSESGGEGGAGDDAAKDGAGEAEVRAAEVGGVGDAAAPRPRGGCRPGAPRATRHYGRGWRRKASPWTPASRPRGRAWRATAATNGNKIRGDARRSGSAGTIDAASLPQVVQRKVAIDDENN